MMLAASTVAVLVRRSASWAQSRQSARAPDKVPDTDWQFYGGDLAGTRYSPLDQINASNFDKLEVAWRFDTNSFGRQPDAYYNCTPLVVKDRLYATAGTRRDVVSLDAATGEQLWLYRLDEHGRLGSRGGAGMGLSYWTDGTKERILFVSTSYYMVSLDAKTGLPDPAFGDNGVVDLRLDDDQQIDPVRGVIGLHAPPLVVRDVVVVGAAPTAAVKGYVRSFDVRTGRRKWIFHTVPRKGEFGYDSWIKPEQTEAIGNTGSWAPMTADPDLGLVYAGIELPSDDHSGFGRWGNALFGETLVALDIETGQRKWHYQCVHHGFQDRDIACAAILCDLPVNGKTVKALALPGKQAYLYVLNRETGKPIWPIPERPVPKGDVPAEWYSPTQPMPSKPPAFDRQGTSLDDLNDWTPEINKRARAIAAHYKMGPLYTPPALADMSGPGPWGTMSLPGNQGGANWPGGSFDPETGLFYIYSKTTLETFCVVKNASGQYHEGTIYSTKNIAESNGGGYGGVAHVPGGAPAAPPRFRRPETNDSMTAPIVPGVFSIDGLPIHKPPYGRITALDLKAGTIAWQVTHGETPDAIRNHPLLKGVKIPRTGQAGILGVLTTKSLVICGDCGVFTDEQGRKAARLRAYDKVTGEEKAALFVEKCQTGSPMTYMLDGKQYLVVAMGNVDGAELIAFRLPQA